MTWPRRGKDRHFARDWCHDANRCRAVKCLQDGTPRSSILYSILDSEWPAAKVHMESVMARAKD
ncbi:MAG: hypothetical protein ABIR98_13045 [Usitatibacter sp.]